MKSKLLIGLIIVAVAAIVYNSRSKPSVEIMPGSNMQIVPIGQQPKDPTKPWCYEQGTGSNKTIVCG